MSTNTSALINAFEQGGHSLAAWTAGLAPADLTSHPVPSTWSIQQLCLHMLDSDLAASHRMRRIVAESTPLLIAYDETAFSNRLNYHTADIKQVADLFRLHRAFTAAWLRTVDPADFARPGVHNQRGKVTLAEWVGIYIDHLTHHEPFLLAKRQALGKPIAAVSPRRPS